MGYNSSATVNMTNNTGGNANITLSHQYSDDSPQISSVTYIASGDTYESILEVGFNTGFIHSGLDYWWIGIEVLDGPNAGSYASEGSADNPQKECLLESEDNGGTLPFTVSTDTFLMVLLSGSCSTSVSSVSSAAAQAAKRSNKVPLEKADSSGRK